MHCGTPERAAGPLETGSTNSLRSTNKRLKALLNGVWAVLLVYFSTTSVRDSQTQEGEAFLASARILAAPPLNAKKHKYTIPLSGGAHPVADQGYR